MQGINILYKEECFKIIGACYAVYNEKGHGFLESVYQECLEYELATQSISFEAQARLSLSYKEFSLKSNYVVDFLCHEKIVLEIKAVKYLLDEHRAQLMNYLRASGMELGLLVNFGQYPNLQWERIVISQ